MGTDERIAALEAQVQRLQQQVEGQRQAIGEIQGIQIPLFEHLLMLLRWAYSHCKSHGHTLRLNDFLIAGNEMKAHIHELKSEG